MDKIQYLIHTVSYQDKIRYSILYSILFTIYMDKMDKILSNEAIFKQIDHDETLKKLKYI